MVDGEASYWFTLRFWWKSFQQPANLQNSFSCQNAFTPFSNVAPEKVVRANQGLQKQGLAVFWRCISDAYHALSVHCKVEAWWRHTARLCIAGIGAVWRHILPRGNVVATNTNANRVQPNLFFQGLESQYPRMEKNVEQVSRSSFNCYLKVNEFQEHIFSLKYSSGCYLLVLNSVVKKF